MNLRVINVEAHDMLHVLSEGNSTIRRTSTKKNWKEKLEEGSSLKAPQLAKLDANRRAVRDKKNKEYAGTGGEGETHRLQVRPQRTEHKI